jgi:hypothetical protein
LLLWACLSANTTAEQKKTFADYDVYYSVINSTFITPQIAQHYGLTRAKNTALVNIAIRKQLPNAASKAQPSLVSGSSSDLIHSSALAFKEVVEQDAIYYLAELRFTHKELRTFKIKVQPDPNIAAYTLEFSTTLYIDE